MALALGSERGDISSPKGASPLAVCLTGQLRWHTLTLANLQHFVLGAVHDVLVTRLDDMRDLPEIARDIVPEFAPDFQRVSVHEGSHAPAAVEARKFRARAARLVAANYTHRFAACDTSRFYPNATRS